VDEKGGTLKVAASDNRFVDYSAMAARNLIEPTFLFRTET